MSEQTPPTGDPGRAPTEEELRDYAERLKQITVEDIIAETIGPLINVATLRAGLVPGSEDQVDLRQLRKAIEASRALIPLVEQEIGPQLPAVKSAISNLQMAYAQLAGQGAGPPAGEAPPGEPPEGPAPGAPAGGQAPPPAPEEPPAKPGEPGPAQRSGRLWVPGQ